MGQKVNPIAFRLAVNKDWRSKWFASGKDYTTKLHEDLAIRAYFKKKLVNAGLARVVIERAWNSVRVTLHSSRPGLIIGREFVHTLAHVVRDIQAMPYQIQGLVGVNVLTLASCKYMQISMSL